MRQNDTMEEGRNAIATTMPKDGAATKLHGGEDESATKRHAFYGLDATMLHVDLGRVRQEGTPVIHWLKMSSVHWFVVFCRVSQSKIRQETVARLRNNDILLRNIRLALLFLDDIICDVMFLVRCPSLHLIQRVKGSLGGWNNLPRIRRILFYPCFNGINK
ncbi:hypothetical protein CA13_66320 [Planctomycetes bacterium CA13]|uniref:Uncharacterized protein n=1 Tax=Novipirellula herctigrandis TaxID=2527986 RepID=A0A5C5ZDB6_9BACT|nr:hypothetical protein CA13_66320 [Planctomycetes bacterium CA13]